MERNRSVSTETRYLCKDQPWVVDQALEIVVCVHLQAIRLGAPFDLPHYASAR